jgi:hypothetical protein
MILTTLLRVSTDRRRMGSEIGGSGKSSALMPRIGRPDGWFLSVALPPYRDTVSHYILGGTRGPNYNSN